MTGTEIIDNYLLSFDPGDPKNGSLYLCQASGTASESVRDALVEGLRQGGLWSSEPLKSVPDDHREAYKAQLEFIEAVSFDVDGATILLARYDHEKFPSDGGRWAAWLSHFDQTYTRK